MTDWDAGLELLTVRAEVAAGEARLRAALDSLGAAIDELVACATPTTKEEGL